MCCLSVDRVTGNNTVQELDGDKYYAKGNSTQLQKYLAKLSDKTDMKVLFCGDSFISDVYPPKYFANWQTVALLEELDVEIGNQIYKNCTTDKPEEVSNYEPGTKRQKLDEVNGTQQDTSTTSQDIVTSATWGSIFSVEDVKTLFGSLVEEYSSLVIAGLDSIAELPVDHSFGKDVYGQTRFYPAQNPQRMTNS